MPAAQPGKAKVKRKTQAQMLQLARDGNKQYAECSQCDPPHGMTSAHAKKHNADLARKSAQDAAPSNV